MTTGKLTGSVTQKGETIWKNGTASIHLETEAQNLSILYQINSIEGTYQTYDDTKGITGLEHGDTVFAVLSDGTNITDYTSIDVLDKLGPTVTVTQGSKSTNNIQVSVSSSDAEWGMPDSITYNYYIKKTADGNYPQNPTHTGTETSYTFTGLIQNTSYDVKVTTSDKAGNLGSGQVTNITTDTVGGAGDDLKEGNIIASEPTWQNGTASITLSKGTGVASYLTIQYQVGDIAEGNWTTAQEGAASVTVTGLKHNDIVYARLTDGINYGSYASVIILDQTNPQNAKIDLSTNTTKENETITATIIHTDNESGVEATNCRWVYNTTSTPIGTEEGSYTGGNFSSNGQTINLTATTAGTYYLHVLTVDKAGNKIESISNAVTVEKGSIPIENITTIQKDNTKAEDKYGNIVTVPKGFKVVTSEGTTVPEGIVIEDNNHNQFVWIPTGKYKVDESGTTKTNDLTRREWGTKDVVKEPTLITGDDEASGRFGKIYFGEGDSRSVANDSIGNFLNSAKPSEKGGNGGFYIGRYEQGKGNVCKSGVSAYVSITRDTAKAQAEAMYTDKEQYGVISQLISSYAWDTALNFICQNSKHGYMLATTTNNDYGNIGTGSPGKRPTGNYPSDCYSNIYDLLGNCYEWTTEYSSDAPCVIRGGCYYEGGNYAASRKCDNIQTSTSFYSFRLSLYIY